MAATDLVRYSRDGDLFHYYWAARRSLELLMPGTEMVALTIEGASRTELSGSPGTGDEIIDVAEYYGAESLEAGGRVVYRQLKHSTTQTELPWTMSGLATTLEKFAAKYTELKTRDSPLHESVTFVFVSNRVVDTKVTNALIDIATAATPRDPRSVAQLRRYLKLFNADNEAEFCQRFSIDLRAPSLLPLMRQYGTAVGELLPEPDSDAATRLKQAVAHRATSVDLSPITRAVVLAELGSPEDQFYPAPPQFVPPNNLIDRDCYAAIAQEIATAAHPVIVHAPGGVGKSVFAQSMAKYLPSESTVIAYDCYGLGSYWRATGYRHAHRQGLVQIANELATRSLCVPLLVGVHSDAAAYARAFKTRVHRAALALGSGLLVIAIDAADNAAMAAKEIDGSRAFIADLLREEFPENVRIVAFCRTERIDYLGAPAGTAEVPMPSLDARESRERIELQFGLVSELEAREFHRRTSGNPRVQDEVLDQASDVAACLSLLGEGYQSPDTAFDDLLNNKFAKTLNDHGIDGLRINSISQVLATLRPRIPINVISELTDTSKQFVESFVSDLGRALLVQGDTVQFRDEPTESWFRSNFRANETEAGALAHKLRTLAERDAYAAGSLPQLLWESGELQELVALALTTKALPSTNNIERREIEEHRVQFALKASLRAGNHFDAATLAFKAGGLAAGRFRHIEMIRANTDLAGEFLDPATSEEIIASRSLRRGWPGSNLVYEGTLLAFNPSTQEDSRNRLRNAEEWLVGWANRTNEEAENEPIKYEDFAEIATGRLVTEGAEACARFIGRLRSPHTTFKVGQLVARRMIQRGDIPRVNALLAASKSNKYLQLAIAGQSMRHYVQLDAKTSRGIAFMLNRHKKKIDFVNSRDYEENEITAISGAVVAALHSGAMTKERAAAILDQYLPERPSRSLAQQSIAGADPVLRAWALRGFVTGKELSVEQIASPEVLEELSGKTHKSTQDGREFRENIVPLLPWLRAWARVACDPVAQPEAELRVLARSLPKGNRRADFSPNIHLNVAAKICAAIVGTTPASSSYKALMTWMSSIAEEIWTTTANDLIRLLSAKAGWDATLFSIARVVASKSAQSPEDADFRVQNLLDLSRALRAVNANESHHYFSEALDIAERMGDEAHARWECTLAVANQAASDAPDDERAFRLARMAEAFYPYLGDGYYTRAVMAALANLSPRSALAIASRWRDRRFGEFGQSIATLTDPTNGALLHSLKTAVALSVFNDQTAGQRALIEAAVVQEPGAAEPLHQVAAELRRMSGLPPATSLDSEETDLGEGSLSSGGFAPNSKFESERAKLLRKLKTLNLSHSGELHAAYSMVKGSRYLGIDTIYSIAFDRPQREWAQFVRTFAEDPELSLFDYQKLFEHAAQISHLPAGVNGALANLAKGLASRFSEAIATDRLGSLSWSDIENVSGVTRDELTLSAFEAFGASSEFLDSRASYSLLMNLTAWLSQSQAQSLFDQIEAGTQYLVDEDAPDHEWSTILEPPTETAGSVAGLVWAALGDADEAIRWRAAHSVRLLGQLGCLDELVYLKDFALSGSAPAFTDERLVFYRDDAILWLLIALDRMAKDQLIVVEKFLPLLSELASAERHHRLMVHHIESILSALTKSAATMVARASAEILASRTWAPLISREVSYSNREHYLPSKFEHLETGYKFDYDFKSDWADPLARCFGADPWDVQSRVSSQILGTWGIRFTGMHEEDARWTKGVFRPGETLSHYSDFPRIHTLDSHITFHALMRVAGELSNSVPAYKDPDSDHDDFTEWWHQHDLTRTDGRWLSDRRDPAPADQRILTPTTFDKDTWRWSVQASDFMNLLGQASKGLVRIWETSERNEPDRSQSIRIRSALVQPERSNALLGALQVAASQMDFRIPSAGDDLELDIEEYVLRGWMNDDSRELGLDRSDGFSGGVGYPPPRPSAEFQTAIRLAPDKDQRNWVRQESGPSPSLLVTTWNDQSRERNGRGLGSKGERVEIELPSLHKALQVFGMDLIVEVSIDRATYDYSGRNNDYSGNEIGYLDDYFKIFLYKHRLGWFDARGPLPTR